MLNALWRNTDYVKKCPLVCTRCRQRHSVNCDVIITDSQHKLGIICTTFEEKETTEVQLVSPYIMLLMEYGASLYERAAEIGRIFTNYYFL